jgi:hypothetical protein
MIKKGIDFDSYIIDRFNKPIDKAMRVFKYVNRITGAKCQLQKLDIPVVPQHMEVIIASKMLSKDYDVVLWGINKYPSDTRIKPSHPYDFRVLNNIEYPFKDLDKSQILQMYYTLGISEILNFTHTCGLNFGRPCGQCFNCREREWAYREISEPINLGC